MAPITHLTKTEMVDVDPSVFDGLGDVRAEAEHLDAIAEQYGTTAMVAVSAGVPEERARLMTPSFAPTND